MDMLHFAAMGYMKNLLFYRPNLRLILGLVIMLWSTLGLARDYAIELIVFERQANADESIEVRTFSAERIAQKLQKLQKLATKADELETDPVLDRLDSIRENFSQSGFRILQTAKWVQPAENIQNAPVVSIGTELSVLPNAFIRVYKTALIYVDLDLQLSPESGAYPVYVDPDNPLGESQIDNSGIENPILAEAENSLDLDQTLSSRPIELQQAHYFISEKRRLKFNEVHYFDHPRFGVILGIWPEESVESEAEVKVESEVEIPQAEES